VRCSAESLEADTAGRAEATDVDESIVILPECGAAPAACALVTASDIVVPPTSRSRHGALCAVGVERTSRHFEVRPERPLAAPRDQVDCTPQGVGPEQRPRSRE